MSRLFELANKASRIDVWILLDKVLSSDETQDMIIELNKEQLTIGQDTTGGEVGQYFSDEYATAKQAIGSKAPFGVVDLLLTGDFYEGFDTTLTGDSVLVFSNDEKADDLEQKYGSEIYGLTEENLNRLIHQQIIPELLITIKNELQL